MVEMSLMFISSGIDDGGFNVTLDSFLFSCSIRSSSSSWLLLVSRWALEDAFCFWRAPRVFVPVEEGRTASISDYTGGAEDEGGNEQRKKGGWINRVFVRRGLSYSLIVRVG